MNLSLKPKLKILSKIENNEISFEKKPPPTEVQELHYKSNLETRFLGSNSKVNFSYAYGTQMLTQKKGGRNKRQQSFKKNLFMVRISSFAFS